MNTIQLQYEQNMNIIYIDLVKVKSMSKLISPDLAHPGPHISFKMPAYGITQKQS